MGLFNWIGDLSMPCPKCGIELTGWQTKDGDLLTLATVSFLSVLEFHTYCRNCNAYHRYTRKIPPAQSIADFELN